MTKEQSYITEDSFGANLPQNWETVADVLNEKIDELEEDEYGEISKDEVDAIWEAYSNGEFDKEIERDIPSSVVEENLSDTATMRYNDSDLHIRMNADGTLRVTSNDDLIADTWTWEDLESFLMTPSEEAEKLAAQIRSRMTWDLDLIKALCKMAGMEEEWDACDGEDWRIVEKAAEKLGVHIY